MQESILARVLGMSRDGFIAFLALLATVSAGAVKDHHLTVYAVLFDAALVAAYIADTFVFVRAKPKAKEIEMENDDAS